MLSLIAIGCGTGTDSGDGETVEFTVCDGSNPTWLAMQDGDGEWTRLFPTTAGSYEATFQHGRGGIAFSYGFGVRVYYAKPGQFQPLAFGCAIGPRAVGGAVAGLAPSERAEITFGPVHSVVQGSDDGTYLLNGVPDGQHDLFAARFVGQSGFYQTTGMIIRRHLDIPSGGTLPALDFSSGDAFPPATGLVTINGPGGSAGARVFSGFIPRHSLTRATLLVLEAPGQGSSQFAVVPEDRLEADELSFVHVDTDGAGDFRTMIRYFRRPTDFTLTLPPIPSVPAVTFPVTAPFVLPSVQMASQPEYGRAVFAHFNQGASFTVLVMTAEYLGGRPATWQLVLPDLSAVPGWHEAYSIAPGAPLSWQVHVTGGTSQALGDAIREGDHYADARTESHNVAAIRHE